MRLPRRGFVKTGVLSAVSAGIVVSNPGLLFSQKGDQIQSQDITRVPLSAQRNPVFSFTQTTFAGFLGDTFTVPSARGEKLALELVNVSGYEVGRKTKMMLRKAKQPTTFSLTFVSAHELPRFSSIHKLNHRRMGEFDLFLTQAKKENGTYAYEAVISHL